MIKHKNSKKDTEGKYKDHLVDDIMKYKIIKYSDKLEKKLIDEGIRQGFKLWEDVTPLTFEQTKDGQDISIEFSDNHDTFLKDPRLAGQALDGKRIVLNNRRYWSFDGEKITIKKDGLSVKVFTSNLPAIIAHEFGHLKGLIHNYDSESIMKPDVTNAKLSSDDIKAMNEGVTC